MHLQIFDTEKLILPDDCYFIVSGGIENDFICPSSGTARAITFPSIESVVESNAPKRVESRNKILEEEGFDIRESAIKSRTIDGRAHNLGVWEIAGISHHIYTICDQRSCIKITGVELDFVRNLVEQISTKTLYSME